MFTSKHTSEPRSDAQVKRPIFFQPKLRVNTPGDAYEQEADQVAEQVMRMREGDAPLVQRMQLAPVGGLQRKCAECEKEEKEKVQRKESGGGDAGGHSAPPIVSDVLSSGSGKTMDGGTRQFMESRFGQDFGQVRIHTGGKAAESAAAIQARAYTSGRDVVFGAGEYRPESESGKQLLAHELVHVGQQGGGIKRKPAALQKVDYDENKILLPQIPDFEIQINGTAKTSSFKTLISPKFNDPTINHACLELFGPDDQNVILNGINICSIPGGDIVSFEIGTDAFAQVATQGRYTFRCTGMANGKNVAYAESSFYVWTKKPIVNQDLAALNKYLGEPSKHTLSEIGAAKGRSMMLEHQDSISKTGKGKYAGNQCTSPRSSGVSGTDCTEYVLSVLQYAFTAKGQKSVYDKIFADAKKNSQRTNADGTIDKRFRGSEMIESLVSIGGWKAVFWSPDPVEPKDGSTEHSYAYTIAKKNKLYYSIKIEDGKNIVDFRKTSPKKREEFSNLDKLKQVSFAVIAARGGSHMTLLLNSIVYEVHWDLPETDPNVIQATPLEQWAWQSGVIAMPLEEFVKSGL